MFQYKTNIIIATAGDVLYTMLQTLAKAGWRVIARSNGSQVNNTPVNNPYPYSENNIGFTASSDLANTTAWFVVQQPPLTGAAGGSVDRPWGGTRQLGIQNVGGATILSWRVKYSFTGAYTSPASNGTVSTMPTPNVSLNDEVYINGDAGSSETTVLTVAGCRMNCFADDGSITGSISGSGVTTGMIPNPWPYGVWGTLFPAGGGAAAVAGGGVRLNWVFIMDPMRSGSIPSQEVDPFVFYGDVAGNASNNPLCGPTNGINAGLGSFFATVQNTYTIGSGNCAKTWFRKGQSLNAFSPCVALHARVKRTGTSEKIGTPNGLGSNYESHLDDFVPIIYVRPAIMTSSLGIGGFGGYKGVSSLLRWTSRNVNHGTTFGIFSQRDRVVMGHCILPWNGTNVLV